MMLHNERLRCIGLFMADAVPFSAMGANVDRIFLFGFSFFVKDQKNE